MDGILSDAVLQHFCRKIGEMYEEEHLNFKNRHCACQSPTSCHKEKTLFLKSDIAQLLYNLT